MDSVGRFLLYKLVLREVDSLADLFERGETRERRATFGVSRLPFVLHKRRVVAELLLEEHMHLIQGFFYQRKRVAGLAYSHDVGGYAVMLRQGIIPMMFAGALWNDHGMPGTWQGALQDQLGESDLTSIRWEPDKLSFFKRYLQGTRGEGRPILYELEKDADHNLWVGTWRFPEASTQGHCRCVITEVDKELFEIGEAQMS